MTDDYPIDGHDDGSDIEYYPTEQLLNALLARTRNPEPEIRYVERPVGMRLVCAVCGIELAATLLPAGNNSAVGTPLSHYCQQSKQLSTFVMEVSG